MARALVEDMQTPRKLCNTCIRALDAINSLLSEKSGAGSQGPEIVTESLVLALRKKGYGRGSSGRRVPDQLVVGG